MTQVRTPAFLLLYLLFLFTCSLTAQDKAITLSGNIRDADSGEDLAGATVVLAGRRTGTVSGADGYYRLSLPSGVYRVLFVYTGYRRKEVEVDMKQETRLDVRLEAGTEELSEVVVSAEEKNVRVTRAQTGMEKLASGTIKTVPALMGEVDVIKAIQLLPGVQSTSEGSSGFSVRGGGHDQNLVLLDEATVYNASHLMGFFSVFNNDALQDVTLYKGDIPASFGGRLSSLLDIRSREGNGERLAATGGAGMISSRLTVEGPLGKNASGLISGRRTYADLFLKLSGDRNLRTSGLYFYDANVRLNYRIDPRNRLSLTGYLGRDRFYSRFAGMDFGNRTGTLRWNHICSPELFVNVSLTGSFYDYFLQSQISPELEQDWRSRMEDWGAKGDFTWLPDRNNRVKFGYQTVYHRFLPGEGGGRGEQAVAGRVRLPDTYALEHALYVSNEMNAGEHIRLRYGLRYTLFQNIANGEDTDYLQDDYAVAFTRRYGKGRFYHHHERLEPRLGLTWIPDGRHSLKASYSRTAQYIQLASNSASGSPLDVWFPASQNVKPQLCDQFAAGYFRNLGEDAYELSAEVYYRDMKDVVDFKDHAELLGNRKLEQELRFGKGRTWGVELMARKNSGKLTGWIGYTLSASRRKTDRINEGRWYRSPYDKPHNLSVVAAYRCSPKWSFAANWVYASGTPVTYPVGRFQVGTDYIPLYSERNGYRYPDYHRLDLSATVQLSRPGSFLRHELNLSLYNAYGRKNTWTILFRPEEDDPDRVYAEKVYLFSLIPSITWNFFF